MAIPNDTGASMLFFEKPSNYGTISEQGWNQHQIVPYLSQSTVGNCVNCWNITRSFHLTKCMRSKHFVTIPSYVVNFMRQ